MGPSTFENCLRSEDILLEESLLDELLHIFGGPNNEWFGALYNHGKSSTPSTQAVMGWA